ncbi:C2H2-type zinc finger transcription factor [Phycomyces blakesleeanus]|uniref:C2H2-type zinc finger transcription factor n=2 Tax=Phycomyces blakesleeanus TaxID=4837 RepID=A0A163A0N0_PHYB8|nr:C2H2-type zinc finger transcription factor [Phycomyces blakesleeanus NRRL 1555(-)]OAD70261.1 C2H2-type zinc finger transcription factor [Phycomyces blakesleeanus NRRL 1555(-)]|eukprot:XP_018288301.1 C2H2-type zinc finger transcription factor [Phycomyces blakesleeanus NRRL 1555(-)]
MSRTLVITSAPCSNGTNPKEPNKKTSNADSKRLEKKLGSCSLPNTFKMYKITPLPILNKKLPDKSSPNIRRCTECSYKTVSKFNLLRHSQTHSETPTKFDCHQCNKTYSSKYNMQRHYNTTHSN